MKEALPKLNNIIQNKGFNPAINEGLNLKREQTIRLINKMNSHTSVDIYRLLTLDRHLGVGI